MIGTTAGPYRILDVISVGGMGTVYRAEHSLIGRIAAVKVLHPEMSSNPDIVTRFFNEAKATTLIKHPGIVEIYDFGYLPSGHAYIVMEFLEGETMAMRNRSRGAIAEGEAAAMLRGVCSALAAAHAKGIVHRDLKPDNIFLVPDPESLLGLRPKILDFGIAKLTDVGLAGTATKTGAVMGTPTYMSPEQCKGTGNVDHRADLYSIGCIFYELVAGRPPFIQHGAGELIGAHLFVQPEPPSRFARISPEVEHVIMALLAKDPAQRPQTAVELGALLLTFAQRAGLASSTSWEQRPSVANVVALPTPAPSYNTNPPIPTANADKPTTLSGAAAEVASKKSSSKWIVGVTALALIGGGIAVVTTMGGSKASESHAAAPKPAPVVEAPKPAPVVEAPKPEPVVEAPKPEPVVEAPKPEPVVEAPKPPEPVAETPKPAETKKPTTKNPPTTKKPAPKKADPLLETDI